MLKKFIVRFDAILTVAITGWPQWLRIPFLLVSFVGQPMCVIVIAMATVAFQLHNTAVVVAIGLALGAMLVNTAIKHFVHRTRPDTLYVSRMYFKSSSFPSGHAFGTAAVFGLLAFLSAAYIAAPGGVALAAALWTLTAAIGISRVYLGAHYPTDVLAGWVLGGTFLWLILWTVQP